MLAQSKSPEVHKQLFERLLDEGLLEMIREDRIEDVDHLLEVVLGGGYRWKDLMKTPNPNVA